MAKHDYPKRPSHFAHKFTRLIFRVSAAQEIGSGAVLLCICVAHTEDAKRYTAAPTFWNDQLQVLLGFSLPKLVRARDKATAAGWLHYEKGSKSRAARYWVTIPSEFEEIPDGDINEDNLQITLQNVRESVGNPLGNPEGMRQTSIPSPNPIPIRVSNADVKAGKSKRVSRKRSPPKVNGRYQYPREFDAIWDLYPARKGRKDGKLEGWRMWVKMDPSEYDDLRTAISKMAASDGYPKNIQTFLNSDWRSDWLDKPAVQKPKRGAVDIAAHVRNRQANSNGDAP